MVGGQRTFALWQPWTDTDTGQGQKAVQHVFGFSPKRSKSSKLPLTANLISHTSYFPWHIGPIFESLPNFEPHEVFHLVDSMPAKSSPTDYIPTSLLLSCSNVFSEITSNLINLSFYHACFLSSFKVPQVNSHIKKSGTNKDDPLNYRQISNLNTISKILEVSK